MHQQRRDEAEHYSSLHGKLEADFKEHGKLAKINKADDQYKYKDILDYQMWLKRQKPGDPNLGVGERYADMMDGSRQKMFDMFASKE